MSLFVLDVGILQKAVPHFVPALDLLDAAAGVLIQRDFILLDELGVLILDEVRRILGTVLAGFGDVVAEFLHELQTDQVLPVGIVGGIFGAALDFRIEVIAGEVGDLQEPGLMVDAGDFPAARDRCTHPCRGCPERLLAQTWTEWQSPTVLTLVNRCMYPASIAMGLGVVQEQGVGAPALHVVGVSLHHGDGPQGAEDAADSQSVGDGLPEAVLFGDSQSR